MSLLEKLRQPQETGISLIDKLRGIEPKEIQPIPEEEEILPLEEK